MIPALHVITDDEILGREGFLFRAREVLEAGGTGLAMHLRGPGCQGRILFDLARKLANPARASGAKLLVNDRVDVALALALEGVHLGQRSLPVPVARSLLGPGKLVGASVHGREETRKVGEGADYLLVGTLFATPSHPQAIPGGLERLQSVRNLTPLSLVGIGGITPDRVSGVLSAGASGVAVRGGVWDNPDPAAAVGVFLDALEGGAEGSGDAGAEGCEDADRGNQG